MEGGKEKKDVIIAPLTNPINLQEDGLKEKEEEAHPNYLPSNHDEEVGPVGHLTHQPNLYEKQKQSNISHDECRVFRGWTRGGTG